MAAARESLEKDMKKAAGFSGKEEFNSWRRYDEEAN
jgi:hypothetical protein